MAFRKVSLGTIFVLGTMLSSLLLSTAHAVDPQTTIKHVIIVIQENRTPDNLFHEDTLLQTNGGNVRPPNDQGMCRTIPVPLFSARLDSCYDTRHEHLDWVNTYDAPGLGEVGLMDGACDVRLHYQSGCTLPTCPPGVSNCAAYTYVPNNDGLLTPYFDLAHQYGFANYMFQTNQGPSFPAHQFLFGGTSLPKASPDPTHTWFAADNLARDPGNSKVGCIAPANERVPLLDDLQILNQDCSAGKNGDNHCVYPCLEHNTLLDVIDSDITNVHLSWRYYAHGPADLWEAPAAVRKVCIPSPGSPHTGIVCLNPKYNQNVVFPTNDKARVITDIEDCAHDFPAVSWVIPDGRWSDHAGNDSGSGPSGHDGGPSWVAQIVNAVGNHTCAPGNTHDTANWNNTVILVVWDDWGGHYDHVSPHQNAGGPGVGYNFGGGGSEQYVFGFRVPLLVVSKYVKRSHPTGDYTGYVSGPLSDPTCRNNNYCHDFGSILNFVEYIFGSGGHYLGSIGDNHSNYADSFAPDAPPTCPTCDYSLSDFFNFSDPSQWHSFQTITGWKYREECFHNPSASQCFGPMPDSDPDDDADEN